MAMVRQTVSVYRNLYHLDVHFQKLNHAKGVIQTFHEL